MEEKEGGLRKSFPQCMKRAKGQKTRAIFGRTY